MATRSKVARALVKQASREVGPLEWAADSQGNWGWRPSAKFDLDAAHSALKTLCLAVHYVIDAVENVEYRTRSRGPSGRFG